MTDIEKMKFHIAESYKQGVDHIRAEHRKMDYKNPSDMVTEELERIQFRIRMTESIFAIDETNSVIEI